MVAGDVANIVEENLAGKPGELGSLSHYLKVFYTSQVVSRIS